MIQPAPKNPGDAEPLTRFIVSTSQFSRMSERVKPNVFMPPPDYRLSVFVVSGLAEATIWDLGVTHVTGPRSKALPARADIDVGVVRNERLNLDVDNVPLRHANVIDWPAEKSQQLIIATVLAEASRLSIRPTP